MAPDVVSLGAGVGRDYVRMRTFGDGSCFWYALAAALNLYGFRRRSPATQLRIGQDLRRRLLGPHRSAEWVTFFRQRGYGDIAPDLASLAPPHVYADEWVISFAAEMLGLRITIFSAEESGKPHVMHYGPDAEAEVLLCHFPAPLEHFEAILRRGRRRGAFVKHVVHRIGRDVLRRSPKNARRLSEDSVSDVQWEGIFPARRVAV